MRACSGAWGSTSSSRSPCASWGFFRYEYFGPFQLLGSPIWLNFAWSPAILFFLYFRPPIRRAFLFWSYLLTYCLMSAMLNETLFQLKLLNQYHWSSLAQFLVAILWFLGAAIFNERYDQILSGPAAPLRTAART